MLDKKTFKRELVRMWDSIRHDGYEGGNDCFGVECGKCPLDLFCNSTSGENIYNLFEINETVEKWSKENPQKNTRCQGLNMTLSNHVLNVYFMVNFLIMNCLCHF